ncbi:MAG: TetR/AcrR family transcriptional regulator [Sandaracinus sp.]
MKTTERTSTRRAPKQERSRQTVEAVLDAVQLVVRRHGAGAITTNRVAAAAGVSIGSLYQYFPDKQAIFLALHDRHVDGVRRVIERTMTDCAAASFEELTGQLVEGLADVHAQEAELHEVLSVAVPQSTDGFESALASTFERALSPTQQDRYTAEETERMLFVLPKMVGALVHGVAREAQASTRARARDEALRTVALYVSSVRSAPGRY